MEKFLAYIDGLLKREDGYEIISETNTEKRLKRKDSTDYESCFKYEDELTKIATTIFPKAWVMTETLMENAETKRIEVRCMIPGSFQFINEVTFILFRKNDYLPNVEVERHVINNSGYAVDRLSYQVSEEKTQKLITLIKQAIFEQSHYRLLHATGIME